MTYKLADLVSPVLGEDYCCVRGTPYAAGSPMVCTVFSLKMASAERIVKNLLLPFL